MPHQQLFNNIFNKDITDSGNMDMLEEITKEHPYFSAAYFFLLKEMRPSHADYKKLATKTALHFNNPFLLNYRLTQKDEPAASNNDEAKPEEKEGTIRNETASSNGMVETIIKEELVTDADIKITEPGSKAPVEILNRNDDDINIPAAAEVKETVAPDTGSGAGMAGESFIAASGEIKKDEIEEPKVNPQKQEKDEPLLFEPLHTTDYFASQGIKLSEETQPADKLGRQLKSFTDWLKTMKKVHGNKMPQGNENMDVAVQQLAEKSNREDEVLTESMAEVYQQQGKIKKAGEIYEKLSLLNPSKSAYFAAKIESLKEK